MAGFKRDYERITTEERQAASREYVALARRVARKLEEMGHTASVGFKTFKGTAFGTIRDPHIILDGEHVSIGGLCTPNEWSVRDKHGLRRNNRSVHVHAMGGKVFWADLPDPEAVRQGKTFPLTGFSDELVGEIAQSAAWQVSECKKANAERKAAEEKERREDELVEKFLNIARHPDVEDPLEGCRIPVPAEVIAAVRDRLKRLGDELTNAYDQMDGG